MAVVELTVNGIPHRLDVPAHRTLLDLLRDDLELTGAKEGCSTGDCGACTVLLNDRLVTACLVLVRDAHGKRVRTVEGLAENGRLHPVQRAFVEQGAVQCGFCIPGMVMAAVALLERDPKPTEARVRQAIQGNLCRCTGYTKIVAAVLAAAMG